MRSCVVYPFPFSLLAKSYAFAFFCIIISPSQVHIALSQEISLAKFVESFLQSSQFTFQAT